MDNWSLIKTTCQTALNDFEACLNRSQQQQATILQSIINTNRDSIFGQNHHFSDIKNYQHFAQSVPIANYDNFQDIIHDLASQDSQQLTESKTIQFEETSGSSSASKLIPYTQDLLNAFQRAILPWLGDLLQQRPAITKGRVFFMISPALRPPALTLSGIPIGSGNDLAYFGETLANHLAPLTLYSSQLTKPQSAEKWKKHITLLLLQASDLSFLSIWSPTLLIILIDYILTHKSTLLPEITDKTQREKIEKAIGSSKLDTQAIWPQLDTISCWDSHTSAVYAQQLQQQFPHAIIQGKGLLSTEAVTSIPYSKTTHPILAINSHFYEFIDSEGHILLAHQLTVGQTYRLIITTQAGLYRYDTGDTVQIAGYHHNTPSLIFTGREGLLSDLCGEKLSESFVTQAIGTVDKNQIGRSLLQAINIPHPHYCWLIENPAPQTDINHLSQQLEQALCQNPQYKYARTIGQLGHLRIQPIKNIIDYYQQHTPNKRLGTSKLPTLLPIT